MATSGKNTSPWIYVGCGCLGCLMLGVSLVAFLGMAGSSMVKGFVEDLEDPVARDERARRILGTDELPAGYHARVFFSIPWILDMVILADGEPITYSDIESADLENGEPFDLGNLTADDAVSRFFFYLAVRGEDAEAEAIFRGDSKVDVKLGASVESSEKIGEGSFTDDDQTVEYALHHGEMKTDDGSRLDGTYGLMKISCPAGDRTRVALWFVQDDEDDTAAPRFLAPSSEAELAEFMAPFSLCGA